MAEGRKGGKKNRKYGRNKLKCEAYRRANRKDVNAAKRQARHVKNLAQIAARKGG